MVSSKFFNPFAKKETEVYKQQETGKIKYVKNGFAWPCQFFGPYWFLFKGMWLYFLGLFVTSALITLLGSPIYYIQFVFFAILAYNARKWYTNHLVSKGYKKIKTVIR
jgi:hypothetical protein